MYEGDFADMCPEKFPLFFNGGGQSVAYARTPSVPAEISDVEPTLSYLFIYLYFVKIRFLFKYFCAGWDEGFDLTALFNTNNYLQIIKRKYV